MTLLSAQTIKNGTGRGVIPATELFVAALGQEIFKNILKVR